MKRPRYQLGTLYSEPRKNGPDVWCIAGAKPMGRANGDSVRRSLAQSGTFAPELMPRRQQKHSDCGLTGRQSKTVGLQLR